MLCRPLGTLAMIFQQVRSPLLARALATFPLFTTTHHLRHLRWPRFPLTTTLTRRYIPTHTRLMHLTTPTPQHLRVGMDQTTLGALPCGEARHLVSVAITAGLCNQHGPRRTQ
jgi:hypothetical protein